MSELRTIRLYGKLGAKFGREFKMAVTSPAEAVQALCSQLPGFETHLTESKDNGVGYAVFNGKHNLSVEQLSNLTAVDEEIRIAPIILGSKSGGVFQIIFGAVLVVVGALVLYFFGWTGIGAIIGKALITMGISMIIGGIVQLLMPAPKGNSAKDKADDLASYAFNGPVNTQAQGNPVPVLYGRLKVGSAVISAGITTSDGVVAPTNTPVFGGGSWGDYFRWSNT